MTIARAATALCVVSFIVIGCGGDQGKPGSGPASQRPATAPEVSLPTAPEPPPPPTYVHESIDDLDSPLRVRPRTMNIKAGSALILSKLRWERWGADVARGRGRVCTSGGGTCHPMRLKLSKIKRVEGRRTYTCLRQGNDPPLCLVPPGEVEDCGDLVESGAGIYNVKATGVSCATARDVAEHWQSDCAQQPSGSCTVAPGFACKLRETGYEAAALSCTAGARKVKFETGA